MMKPSLVLTTLVSSMAAMYAPTVLAQAAAAPSAAASSPDASSTTPASPNAKTKSAALETVMVTGYRASLERAMDIKRNANSIVDAISAEDIGKFPDTNAAESLSHLPGVAVDRLYGEGEKVSINGTDPALNRVLVNGQTIASGDWGGNPSDTSGRTFNYTLLSPEIIGQMEIYKSPEARIDEGSIGGTVIIHTRKPLELPANTLRGSLGYSYNDRSSDGNPRGSLLYSWKNDAKDFGFLATVTHDKQNLSQGGVEFFGYGDGSGIPSTATITGSGNVSTAKLAAYIDSDFFQQPNEKNELNLTGVYVKGKYNNFSQARYVGAGGASGNITSATLDNGVITSGTVSAANSQPYAEQDANYRESTVVTKSLNLSHEFSADGWKLKTQGGYTSASGGKNPEYLMKFLLQSGGYSFSYGPKSASVKYDTNSASASNWGLEASPAGSVAGDSTISGKYQAGGISYSVSHDNERYGQMDFSRDLDWGPINEVLIGGKVLRHKNGVNAWGNRINTTDAISLAQFTTGNAPSGLYDGLDVGGDMPNWATADLDKVKSYLLSQPQGPYSVNRDSTFGVEEKTQNLYTQFNYELNKLRGNFGVRYLHTSDSASYYLSSDGGTTYTSTTTDTAYNKFLPSFNAAYDLDPTKTVRFSVAKVLARPRYSDLAGATTLDSTKLTGSGGNPALKPYESTNFDLAGEWNFAKQGMVGAELFFRDVDSYVVSVTNDRVINGQTYSISSPVNASSAKVMGTSFMYQQALWHGFGIESNYTWAKANTANGLNMPYLSKNTINLIPYYENGPFMARLIYSWRSQYFTQVGRLNSQVFTGDYKELGLSASYEINKQISVNLNASNLLDSTYFQYNGDKNAPVGFYKNGRTFMLSMTMKM